MPKIFDSDIKIIAPLHLCLNLKKKKKRKYQLNNHLSLNSVPIMGPISQNEVNI